MSAVETLGRFGHHPDPAIDFCVEVEEILSAHHGQAFGDPVTRDIDKRIYHAMMFRVGGDQGAVGAKTVLRRIEAERQRGFGEVKSWDCWPFGEPCEWPDWWRKEVTAKPEPTSTITPLTGQEYNELMFGRFA